MSEVPQALKKIVKCKAATSVIMIDDSNENGNHLRTVYENCGSRNEFESDLRRKEHYLNSSVNKV